jgi:predicted MFS family arabinose efflux permease
VTVRLLRDRRVRALLLVQWLPPAFITGAEALVVPYAAERGFAPGAAGLMLAFVPAGMLAGNLAVGRLLSPSTRERMVSPMLIGFGAPLAALAAPVQQSVAAALLFVAGAGFSYALGVQRPFLEALDPSIRGQGFAVLTTGLMTLQGVGPLVLGLVAQYVSTAAAMVVSGLGTATVGVVWWSTGTRRAPLMSQSPERVG